MSDGVALAVVIILTVVLGGAGVVVGIAMRWWYLLAAAIGFLVVMAFGIVGFAAWSWHDFVENGCIAARGCYCEMQNPTTGLVARGMIRQPGGTISAFAPVITGFLILGELEWRSAENRTPPMNIRNPMMVVTVFSMFYACIVIFLGPGSMAFHASLKHIPGKLDPISILLFANCVLFYSMLEPFLRRNAGLLYALFFIFFLANCGWQIALVAAGHEDVASISAIAMLGAWELLRLVLDIIARADAPDPATAATRRPAFGYRSFGWSIAMIVAFGLAFILWALSDTGGALCTDPYSNFGQGHVFWHIGAMGLAPYFIFRSFFSEHHAHRLTEQLLAGGGGGSGKGGGGKGGGGWSGGGKMGSAK